MGKRALTHRVSLAVAGLRRFVLTLLSALLVGCGGDGSDSGADMAVPTPVPPDTGLEPQRIGFDQPGPFNLVVGDTLSNVASCTNGQMDNIFAGQSVRDTVFTLNQTAYVEIEI